MTIDQVKEWAATIPEEQFSAFGMTREGFIATMSQIIAENPDACAE